MLSPGLYLSGLWPPFATAISYLMAYCESYGYQAYIASGFRSSAEQARLYQQGRTPDEVRRRVSKRINVDVVTNAPPGTSAHEFGLAVDVEGRDQSQVVALARSLGFGTVSGDPAHIEWPNWRQLVS